MINDLEIQTFNLGNTTVYVADNFFSNPDVIYKEFFSTLGPIWHPNLDVVEQSLNQIYFIDRRKYITTSIKKNIDDIVKNLTGYNPSSNQIYTNETIFFDEPLNDWDNYYFNVHRDMGYNFIVYLNKDSEECGTNLYDYDQYDSLTNLLHYGAEHVHPWVAKSKIARMAHLKGKYNRMVLFDGKLFPHGMNIIKNKFTDKYRQNITSFYE